MMIVEEAAATDEKVAKAVVAPTIVKRETGLMLISTITDRDNWFSRMIELKDARDEPLFQIFDVQMVCSRQECRKHPEKCWHMVHLLPHWHGFDKVDLVRRMLSDDQELMKREILCVHPRARSWDACSSPLTTCAQRRGL